MRWLSKKCRKPRHVATDNDAAAVAAAKSPPSRWQNESEEDVFIVAAGPSPTSIRSCTPVKPQPLPLPELSAASAPLLRHRENDCRLPSPKDAPSPTAAAFRSLEDRDASTVDREACTGFRMRSVFASQETRRNAEPAESKSSRVIHQDLIGSENTRDNHCISVPVRGASGSPFTSPQRTRNGEFIPYQYVTPKGNQFWSAPELPTREAGLPPTAFFDLSALGTETSPHQSPQVRSPQRHLRCSSGPPSPVHSMLSPETSTTRRESNVHPLPLPPGAALPSPSATGTSSSHATTRSESCPMKNQWQKGKLIGRGTFGSVYVATNRETGALCAMKEVELYPEDPKSAECIKQLEQEIKVLRHLKHPNIVQYYGSEIAEDRFYIYLEYVHPGSINKYIRDHCGAMTESVIRNFTRHILSGLAYLHGKKTIHRDIKGANLLVDSAGVVKLADFGMAKHLTGYEADLSLRGSPNWMAPELMQAVMQRDNSSDLAFAIDIWSLGCSIIEMYTGKPPWSEYEGAAAMFKVMKDSPPIPETLSSDGKDFLRCCFKRNPAERPTAAMLLEHRFLKNSQQPDVSSSTQLYNGTSFLDKPHSPRGQSDNKSDQMSISSANIARGKAAERRGFLVPSLDILPSYWGQ
ncbi:hypothetical protein RIF29_33963 [Crotalaria pallida]|uniref:mitogen-activated protein kinase kinase kinase n=1 Tax=Crotalaria pallida TaxID=3830 RepID=A0AAN9HX48_CROPI